jgi:hypothetical protein
MENLDLDIHNYSIHDVERFFKLKKKEYTINEIELRETQIREQLLNSGHVNKRFKRDLILFLDSAKKILVDAKCKPTQVAPTTIPDNYKLDSINNPVYKVPNPREENLIERPHKQFVYTQSGEFMPGNLNQLNTRVISKCLNIDTRFRTNFHNTNSSDITIQLPTRFNKVVSMELSTIELPVSFYGISESYGNNYMHITLKYIYPCIDTAVRQCHRTIIVPDGNYTETDLIDTLNYMLSKPGDAIEEDTNLFIDMSGNIFDNSGNKVNLSNQTIDGSGNLLYDEPKEIIDVFSFVNFKLDVNANGSGSRRVSFGPVVNDYIEITEIVLDFSKNINGELDNTSLYTKLGWNIGFTKATYSGDNFYNAETIIEPATKYLYLAVDDFNNNSNSNFISVFNQSIMNTDILARISIKGARYNLLSENNFELVSEPRMYFGPVDIQRLRIRLLDEHGRILQMNNSNYSFCLKLKLMYDM